MPVESEQAQAASPVTAQPRPPHDQHELPDGRYLIAYRSAPNA